MKYYKYIGTGSLYRTPDDNTWQYYNTIANAWFPAGFVDFTYIRNFIPVTKKEVFVEIL